jgi:hypothetical protein
MNESLMESRFRLRSVLKGLVWNAASRVALHGLCTWELEDHWVLVHQGQLRIPGLGRSWQGATIAHLTDLHFSPLMFERHMMQFVELVNGLEPDFVAITGDFITNSTRRYVRQAGEVLSHLAPRVASIACLGNHDYGVWHPRFPQGVPGLKDELVDHLARAGVRPMINTWRRFRRGGDDITFVGLADVWAHEYDPDDAFRHLPAGPAPIALCHNPDAAEELARRGAGHVLAGHTHGKPTPPGPLNNLFFPVKHRDFVAGEYDLGADRRLYVNRGIGPSRRVETDHRPEIALFTLTGGPRDIGRN